MNGGCLDLALRDRPDQRRLFAACGTLDQATVYRRIMTDGGRVGGGAVRTGHGAHRRWPSRPPTRTWSTRCRPAISAVPDGNFEQGLHAVFRSAAEGGAAGSWQARVATPIRSSSTPCCSPTRSPPPTWSAAGPTSNSWINMGWYANVVAVDPVDPDVVWAAGVDLFRSDDGGRSWGLASYWWMDRGDPQFVHADQHAHRLPPRLRRGRQPDPVRGQRRRGLPSPTTALRRWPASPTRSAIPARVEMRWTLPQPRPGDHPVLPRCALPRTAQRFLGGTQDNGTLLLTEAAGHDDWLHVIGGDGGYVAINPDRPEHRLRRIAAGQHQKIARMEGFTSPAHPPAFRRPPKSSCSSPRS